MTRRLSALVFTALTACGSEPIESSPSAAPASVAPAIETAAASSEDVRAVGQGLVAIHECNRCHEGTGFEPASQAKSCVSCHLDIAEGRFKAPPAALAEWKPHVMHLRYAPSLSAAGSFVRPDWIKRYLLEPADLRPSLHANMPRFGLTGLEADAIAVYFGSRALPASQEPALAGDIERGRALFTTKTCASCHAFSGAGTPARGEANPLRDGKDRMLAPDLRFARERLVLDRVPAYIADPASVKEDAAMPKVPMSAQEAADLAAFVLQAPLMPLAEPTKPPRLPLLDRPVGYDEVAEKILHKICWHCHSQPDFSRGDGGPGNTGGFGFKPRLLDLASYESLSAGYLDKNGERRSLFSPGSGKDPVLLEVLLARQKEERGSQGSLRGMPLGMPSLSVESIQLVETWISQGHAR